MTDSLNDEPEAVVFKAASAISARAGKHRLDGQGPGFGRVPGRAEVASVRLRWREVPLEAPVRMSFGGLQRRVMAVVEVVDTDGHRGWGETWANYPSWVMTERAATVEQGLAPLLVGAVVDLFDVEHSIAALQARLVEELWPLGRQWGALGPMMQAVSGADQALWDLAGRRRGLAVAGLVGETHPSRLLRRRVPVYASGVGPEDVLAQVERCVRAGFQAVKLRVGFGTAADKANLVAARRGLGANRDLLVDANQAWSFDDAVSMADVLRDVGVAWVEEPIADADPADLAAFARRTGLAVAAGENVYGRRNWLALLDTAEVRVVQPDVSKQGGITELLWICGQATHRGRRVEPHLYGGRVALAATLQVAACCPGVNRVEFDVRPNPLREGGVPRFQSLAEKSINVPAEPGLGTAFADEYRSWRSLTDMHHTNE